MSENWPGRLTEHDVRVMRAILARSTATRDACSLGEAMGRTPSQDDFRALLTLSERGMVTVEGWRIRPRSWGVRALGFKRFRDMGH